MRREGVGESPRFEPVSTVRAMKPYRSSAATARLIAAEPSTKA